MDDGHVGPLQDCRIVVIVEEEGREEENGEECSSARGGLYSWQPASRWIRTAATCKSMDSACN